MAHCLLQYFSQRKLMKALGAIMSNCSRPQSPRKFRLVVSYCMVDLTGYAVFSDFQSNFSNGSRFPTVGQGEQRF